MLGSTRVHSLAGYVTPSSFPSPPPLFPPFPRVSLVSEACSAVQFICSFLGQEASSSEGTTLRKKVEKTCSGLSLLDLNYALYRCDSEEKDDGHGGGAYVVPGAGALVYCGLQGIMAMLSTVRDQNDLGHPICDNLRAGDWMIGYTANRLKLRAGTEEVCEWVGGHLECERNCSMVVGGIS